MGFFPCHICREPFGRHVGTQCEGIFPSCAHGAGANGATIGHHIWLPKSLTTSEPSSTFTAIYGMTPDNINRIGTSEGIGRFGLNHQKSPDLHNTRSFFVFVGKVMGFFLVPNKNWTKIMLENPTGGVSVTCCSRRAALWQKNS